MSKKTRVMGFGTFDGLHPGHLDFFRQLRALGDEVIVVVARDKNVEKIKGHRPKRTETERLDDIKKSGVVDHAELGNPDFFYQCLIDHSPDIVGLGYDQYANEEEIRNKYPHIRLVRLEPFEPDKYKSSLLA